MRIAAGERRTDPCGLTSCVLKWPGPQVAVATPQQLVLRGELPLNLEVPQSHPGELLLVTFSPAMSLSTFIF